MQEMLMSNVLQSSNRRGPCCEVPDRSLWFGEHSMNRTANTDGSGFFLGPIFWTMSMTAGSSEMFFTRGRSSQVAWLKLNGVELVELDMISIHLLGLDSHCLLPLFPFEWKTLQPAAQLFLEFPFFPPCRPTSRGELEIKMKGEFCWKR